jgi:hypothetical protein
VPNVASLRSLVGAISLALVAAACGDDTSAPVTEPFVTSFDRMWNTVDREYSYFEYKGIDWYAVRSPIARALSARPTRPTSSRWCARRWERCATCTSGSSPPDGRFIGTYTPTHRRNWSIAIKAAQLQRPGWVNVSPSLYHANLDGVAYIAIATFANGQFDVAAFDAVLDRYRDARAIVLDVRMNGGGNDALAYQVAGRFTTATRTTGYVQYRNGLRHDAFTALTARTVGPRGGWQFTRPVVLLTGRGAYSSTEGFVSAMQVLPNVTLVGDTTGGGSGNPSVYPLRDGYGISVSRWIEYTADRQPIEWRGIAPDSTVAFSEAAVAAGEDETLTYALDLAVRLPAARLPARSGQVASGALGARPGRAGSGGR